LADLAYTYNTGRAHFETRIAMMAKTKAELISNLTKGASKITKAASSPPKIAFFLLDREPAIPKWVSCYYETQPVFSKAWIIVPQYLINKAIRPW